LEEEKNAYFTIYTYNISKVTLENLKNKKLLDFD
jgi:hypothetical protein